MMLLKLLRSLKILFFNVTILEKPLKKKKKKKKTTTTDLGFPGGSVGSPAKRETQVQPLGGKDPREKGTATHSSILA